jgi:HAMP domain-containing protein
VLRSATLRLVVAHLVLVAASTALVLGFLYWRVGGVIDAEQREVVEAELRGLADAYARGGTPGLAAAINQRLANPPDRDPIYLLADARGRPIAGNLSGWPPTVRPGGGWTTLELYRTDRSRPTEISGMALRQGELLLVGRDVAARAAFDRTLGRALLWALAALTALALLTGWLLSRLVRGRIAEIDGAARGIMAGAFDRRVALRGTGDEFDRLAGTLNAMLDRIETCAPSPTAWRTTSGARSAGSSATSRAPPTRARRPRRGSRGSSRRSGRPRACSPPRPPCSTSPGSRPGSAPSSSSRSTSAVSPPTSPSSTRPPPRSGGSGSPARPSRG